MNGFEEVEKLIERAESLVLAARTLPPAERLAALAEAKRLEREARAALIAWYARRSMRGFSQ